jgi:hypothetical protein
MVKEWYNTLKGRLRPSRVRSCVLWRSASHSSFVLDLECFSIGRGWVSAIRLWGFSDCTLLTGTISRCFCRPDLFWYAHTQSCCGQPDLHERTPIDCRFHVVPQVFHIVALPPPRRLSSIKRSSVIETQIKCHLFVDVDGVKSCRGHCHPVAR